MNSENRERISGSFLIILSLFLLTGCIAFAGGATAQELITTQDDVNVEPGEEFTINITADNVDILRVEGDTEGFNVVEWEEFGEALATTPDPEGLPVELSADDEIRTGQVDPSRVTLTTVIEAPDTTGTFEFNTTAEDTAADQGEIDSFEVNIESPDSEPEPEPEPESEPEPEPETESEPEPEPEPEDQPGFNAVPALVALTVAALIAIRRTR